MGQLTRPPPSARASRRRYPRPPAERRCGRGTQSGRGKPRRRTWIAFLDADDLWMPDKLERQLSAARQTAADVCSARVDLIDVQGLPLPPVHDDGNLPRHRAAHTALQGDAPGHVVDTLVRRSSSEDVGGYDPKFATMADWDLLIRLRLARPLRIRWRASRPLSALRRDNEPERRHVGARISARPEEDVCQPGVDLPRWAASEGEPSPGTIWSFPARIGVRQPQEGSGLRAEGPCS